MYELLFKDITNRLAGEVPDLRWVDLDFGQLDLPEQSYPLQFPCALVDMPNANFMDETHGNQQGVVVIAVTLALDIYEDYHIADGVEAPQRDIAFNRLSILTKIHKALQCFEGVYFTPLVRTDLQSEKRQDLLKVFTLFYKTEFKDDSAAQVYDTRNFINMQV